MEKVTRDKIFADAARRLRQEFESLRSVPHAGSRGTEGEHIVQQFLNEHLPQRFRAGGGFVIDPVDEISKQTDVVIYDAHNCPIYRVSDVASIFPNDNVAAVVEVKSRLDKERLFEAAANIAAAKALRKSREPDVPWLVNTYTLGCVFAFESAISDERMLSHYLETLQQHGLGGHIDVIAILDRSLFTLIFQMPSDTGWNVAMWAGSGGPGSEGAHFAIGVQPAGEQTLDAFFRILLAHLTYFRGIVPHPGFKLHSLDTKEGQLLYFMSMTHETEPLKRAAKLREYENQVRLQFGMPILPTD